MSQIDFYTAVAAGSNIALAFLGAIVSVYEKWTKKYRTSILVSFVGALGCMGFVAAIVDASKAARDLQDANARVKAAVDKAGRKEVAATTGGDSFCYAKIDPTRPTKPGTLDLMVIHHGKYALHDVTLFFYDSQRAMNIGMRAMKNGSTDILQETLKQATRRIKLEPLMPDHYDRIGFDYKPLQTNSHEYSFSFSGPNGKWDEDLRLKLVNHKWVQALRVREERPDPKDFFSQKQTVLEDVDDGFPTPVNWGHGLKPVPNTLPLN